MATSAVRMLRPKPPCVRSHSHQRLTERSTRDSAGCQSLCSSILALAWLIPTKSAMHFMTSDQWRGIVSSPSLWSRHGYSNPTETAAVPHMAGTHQGEDMKTDPMRLRSNAERRYCIWKKSSIKLKKTPTQKRNEILHSRLLVAVMFVAGRERSLLPITHYRVKDAPARFERSVAFQCCAGQVLRSRISVT